MEKVPKPIVFFFHTDWCNYCAMQKKQLKNDDFLKNMLNEQFYFVDFNAESEDIVHFNGDSYDNVKQNKYAVHSLTRHFFTDNSPIGYPAWVITDKNYNVIFKYQGLLKPEKLKEIFALAIKQ